MDIRELADRAAKRDLTDAGALEDYFECVRLLEETDFAEAHERSKQVRKISAQEAKRQVSARMLDLNKRSLLFDAPYDFDCFLRIP